MGRAFHGPGDRLGCDGVLLVRRSGGQYRHGRARQACIGPVEACAGEPARGWPNEGPARRAGATWCWHKARFCLGRRGRWPTSSGGGDPGSNRELSQRIVTPRRAVPSMRGGSARREGRPSCSGRSPGPHPRHMVHADTALSIPLNPHSPAQHRPGRVLWGSMQGSGGRGRGRPSAVRARDAAARTKTSF